MSAQITEVCMYFYTEAMARSPVGGGDDTRKLPTLSIVLFVFLLSAFWPKSTRTKYLFVVKVIISNIIVNRRER